MKDIQERIEKIKDSFHNSIYDVLNTMTGINLEIKNLNEPESCDFSGGMFLRGESNDYLFVISTNTENARIIISYMTGLLPEEISNEDLIDGMAELVNMIAGKVKILVAKSDNYFKLTSPFTIKGKNHFVFPKSNSPQINSLFYANDLFLNLSLTFI